MLFVLNLTTSLTRSNGLQDPYQLKSIPTEKRLTSYDIIVDIVTILDLGEVIPSNTSDSDGKTSKATQDKAQSTPADTGRAQEGEGLKPPGEEPRGRQSSTDESGKLRKKSIGSGSGVTEPVSGQPASGQSQDVNGPTVQPHPAESSSASAVRAGDDAAARLRPGVEPIQPTSTGGLSSIPGMPATSEERGDGNEEAPPPLPSRPVSSAAPQSRTSATGDQRATTPSRDGRHSERTESVGRRSADIKPTVPRHYLLPLDVPNARMLLFSCTTPKKISKPNDFLNEMAEKFVQRLITERKGKSNVPIVFLAHGFGALVLQMAIGLLVDARSKLSADAIQILDQTTGIIFVNALFPAGEVESKDRPAGVPLGPNAGIPGPHKEWVEKKSIDAEGIWKSFHKEIGEKSKCLVWFYNPGQPDKKGTKLLVRLSTVFYRNIRLTFNRIRFQCRGYSSRRFNREICQGRNRPISAILNTETYACA